MTKAFAYLRVSGLSQVDGDGFTRQREKITEFAAANGYDLVAAFPEEGVSGKNDETTRPAFAEMMAAILSNGVRTIIVERLDRLAREYRIQENLLIYLAGKEVDLISADTGENVTQAIKQDPMKKALVQMQGVFFELERSMLVKKLRAARDRKRKETGRCEGGKPFGEKPEEKPVVARIVALRGEGKNAQQIADALNAENTATKFNGKWHRTSVIRVLKRNAA